MSRARDLVLVGPPGAGKSVVGRRLADRLGRAFVDLDEMIAGAAGASIPTIFATEGERGFRRREREACRAWCAGRVEAAGPRVLATGGGTILDEANRRDLEACATLILLDLDVETAIARLQGSGDRPLLHTESGQGFAAALRRLYRGRAPIFHSVLRRVDAGGSVEEVAAAVQAVAECSEDLTGDRVLAGRGELTSTPIVIGDGALGRLAELLELRGLGGRPTALILPEPVDELYGAALEETLGRGRPALHRLTVPDGEAAKTLDTASELWRRCAAAGLDRGGLIVACGGGVTTDLAGFVAATWMRGLELVLVPTSLLAMVDASIGGKTAVDRPEGKNLVGAFHRAELVVMDPELLATLPERERRCGLAELLKHGLIGDAALFSELAGVVRPSVAQLERGLRVKLELVEADPRERLGRRALLNLGHTFGHAIERVSGYRIRHGEAVAAGLVCAARLGAELGWSDGAVEARVRAVVESCGLATRLTGLDHGALIAALGADKKRRAGRARFIAIRAPGEVAIVEDPPAAAVAEAFRAGLA